MDLAITVLTGNLPGNKLQNYAGVIIIVMFFAF